MPPVDPISKTNTGYPDYLDFRRLREAGLRHIQAFSGQLWTDHNLHDPGITLLEALCYALLDLGYRTNFDIPDLLAGPNGQPPAEKQFFTAAEILSNNPLTIQDYRKLLLDIRGVRNAWLEKAGRAEIDLSLNCASGALEAASPSGAFPPGSTPPCSCAGAGAGGSDEVKHPVRLNGLYRVLLELEPVRPEDQAAKAGEQNSVGRILDEARARLHAHRNLCEDFLDIQILQEEQIAVCAHLEIAPDYDPEAVLLDMYERLRLWLSPALSFYTLSELLEKGRTMEEIFEGRPLLPSSHGFVDTEELENLQLPTELHASDLYRVILETPGILAVRKLMLFNYIDGQPQTSGADWCLHLTPGYHPVLAPELGKITLFKDGVPFAGNQKEVLERYTERLSSARKNLRKPYELDLPAPEGEYRTPGQYWSVQHDLPAVYGIGEGGLPDSAPPNRKAQALQLKAYLLFFDQLLANYLGQLAHLHDFFALQPTAQRRRSYFPGDVSSIPDLSAVIRGGEFNQNGEPITGSAYLYRRGAVIVFPYDAQTQDDVYAGYRFFANPRLRDDIARQAQRNFQNETFSIRTEEDDCGLFRFVVHIPMDMPDGGKALELYSKPAFKTADEARQEGEALSFLGLSGDHYRSIDHPSDTGYSFELAYEPRPYAQILESIAETPAGALARRDKFLDHLLARFAEDFSDYALLQIDDSGRRSPLENLVQDKEAFLADYPDISRNRGRAFDYTGRLRLWDTDNITGLENRAGALMGIDPRERHTLAPFDTAPVVDPPEYRLHDFRCRTLWVSRKHFPSFDAFRQRVLELAADCRNYRRIECCDYSRFGFALYENPGTPQECLVAIHPDFYATPGRRDAKMEYFAGDCSGASGGIFGDPGPDGLPGAGLFLKLVPTDEGFVFSVEKPLPDGSTKTLLKSSRAYPDSKEDALAAWVEFTRQALREENYRILADPYGKGFGVAVLGEDGQPLAQHPAFYADETAAQAVLVEILDWIKTHRPDTALLQAPSSWIWQLSDGKGNLLLENAHPFSTRAQAAAGLERALRLSAEPGAWEPATDAGGKHTFFLVEHFPATGDAPACTLRLARHPQAWDAPADRDAALLAAKAAADPKVFFNKHLVTKNQALRLLWTDAQGTPLLTGVEIYADTDAARAGFECLLDLAKAQKNFRFDKDESLRVLLLDDSGQLAACSNDLFYTPESAGAFVQQLTEAAAISPPAFNTATLPKAFAFRLTDAAGKKALSGARWFETDEEARAAFLEALHFARQPEHFEAAGTFFIQLTDGEGRVLAVSEKYGAEMRDAALAAYRDYFSSEKIKSRLLECPGAWSFEIYKDGLALLLSAADYETENDAAVALEHTLAAAVSAGNYRRKTAPDACKFSFDIVKDPASGEALALHPVWYDTETARDEALDALLEWFQTHTLPHNIDWQNPEWHYELCWESCEERIEPALTGAGSYATAQDAADAFWALQAQTAALPEAQKTDPFEYPHQFGICYAYYEDLAASPRWFETAALRDQAKTTLAEAIKNGTAQVQYFQTAGQWRYELRLDPAAGPDLASQTPYPTQEAAAAAAAQLMQRVGQLGEWALAGIAGKYGLTAGSGAAFHPDTYANAAQAEKTAKRLADYLRRRNWKQAACADDPPCVDMLPPEDEGNDEAPGNGGGGSSTGASRSAIAPPAAPGFVAPAEQHAFRVRKEQGELAVFQDIFPSARLRNDALCALQEEMRCRLPEYSTVDCDGFTVVAAGKRFVFQIKSGDMVWWISGASYATREEAWEAFENNYLRILELASRMENYQTACQDGVACYFWLPDPGNPQTPIARTPDFPPGADLVAEFEKRLRHARSYPVFRGADGRFCFRITDVEQNAAVWISSRSYATEMEAKAAFDQFLNLLQYPQNYVLTGDTANCRFGFVLWEPGLEGLERFAGTANASAEDNAWEGLNDCLVAFGDSARFFTWLDVAGGCRFGLHLAEDTYRLARHPRQFHTPADREAALENLFHRLQCACWTSQPCNCYWFWLNPAQDCGRTYLRAKVQANIKWDTQKGLLCFEKPAGPCANQNENRLEAEKLIDLMAAARARECYVPVVDPTLAGNPNAPWQLGLLNASLQLIGFSAEAYCPDEWAKCREEAIEQAWQFPLVRRNGGFGFQLAVGQEVLLESIHSYPTPLAASEAFCRLLELIREKSNLVGTEPGICGPFGIEMRDPAKIKAIHPATYADCAGAEAAADMLGRCLDAEGFHLIEHILLRPRETPPDRYFILKNGGEALLAGACPLPPAAYATPLAYAQARQMFLADVQRLVASRINALKPFELAAPSGESFVSSGAGQMAALAAHIDPDTCALLPKVDSEKNVKAVKAGDDYFIALVVGNTTLLRGNTAVAGSGGNPPVLDLQQRQDFLADLRKALQAFCPKVKCTHSTFELTDAGCALARAVADQSVLSAPGFLLQLSKLNDAHLDISPALPGGVVLGRRFELYGTGGAVVLTGLLPAPDAVALDESQLAAGKQAFLDEARQLLNVLITAKKPVVLKGFNNAGVYGAYAESPDAYDLQGAIDLMTRLSGQNILVQVTPEDTNIPDQKRYIWMEENGQVLFTRTWPLSKTELEATQLARTGQIFLKNTRAALQRLVTEANPLQLQTAGGLAFAQAAATLNYQGIIDFAAQLGQATAAGVRLVPDPGAWLPPVQCWAIRYEGRSLLVAQTPLSDAELATPAALAASRDQFAAAVLQALNTAGWAPTGAECVPWPLEALDPATGQLLARSPEGYALPERRRLRDWLVQQLQALQTTPPTAVIQIAQQAKYTGPVDDCRGLPANGQPPVMSATALLETCVDPDECRAAAPGDYIPGADPYSFWATVAIPYWGRRFRNVQFRQFFEKTLRQEAPAHVALRIGWISPRQMMQLEKAWRSWLEANALGADSCLRTEAQNRLLCMIQALRNRYHDAVLHECDVPGGEGGDFVLLDQTILGE